MPRKKEVWCTNIDGASKIMNRTSRTVSNYVKEGLLDGSFRYGNSKLIPMSDVAKLMRTTESNVVKFAKTRELPLWICKR